LFEELRAKEEQLKRQQEQLENAQQTIDFMRAVETAPTPHNPGTRCATGRPH